MKWPAGLIALLLVTACTQAIVRDASAAAPGEAPPAQTGSDEAVQAPGATVEAVRTFGEAEDEATWETGAPAMGLLPELSLVPPEPVMHSCSGILKQGGLVICEGEPGDVFRLGAVEIAADETGTVQFGLAQRAPLSLEIRSLALEGALEIGARQDAFRTVPGFDCDRVDARTPAQRAHAARSWEIKQGAFAQFHAGRGALDGFIRPAEAPPSSPFGPTRKYIGVSKTSGEPCESMSVHQGYDLAAPVGTPVVAPAAGVVTLADPDLYYEGGTIFLDHGHGLLSVFMHLSEVNVAPGDVVGRGKTIAKTGNTGRSTGPHLHWGVKWRNPASPDRGADFYIDPALLLELPVID